MFRLMAPAIFLLVISSLSHAELTLNGLSTYQQLSREYYLIAFETEKPVSDEQQIFHSTMAKRLELRISRERWTPNSFSALWIRDFSIGNDLKSDPALAEKLLKFAYYPARSLRKGDTFSIEYTPGTGTSIKLNNAEIISTKDDEVFNAFANIWLGKLPPSRKLKEELLAAGGVSTDLVYRFYDLVISPERIEIVKNWEAEEQQKLLAQKRQREIAKKKAIEAAALAKRQEEEKKRLVALESAKKKEEELAKMRAKEEAAALAIAQQIETNKASQNLETAQETKPANTQISDSQKLEEQKEIVLAMPEADASDLISVQDAEAIYRVEPDYPYKAAREGKEGYVQLAYTVTETGTVENIFVVDSKPKRVFEKEAIKALSQWKYKPRMEDGIGVKQSDMQVKLVFSLN